MDIHKPAQWHGWREFLKEIGTIVIGVLIALAAEQAVEWLHWRSAVGEARIGLRQEVAANVNLALMDREQSACILAKLGAYEAWAQGGPQPNIGSARLVAPTSTVWDIIKAGQTASHMPVKEQLAYADFYANVANLQSVIQSERSASARFIGHVRKTSFTPDELARFSQDLSEAGVWYRAVLKNDEYVLAAGQSLGVRPHPLSAETRQRLADLCAPMPGQGKATVPFGSPLEPGPTVRGR